MIDAGSTDGSRQYLSSLSLPNLKTIFESDEGPADGLNKGLRIMTGDIFMYLNSDDELVPGSLRVVSELHSIYPEDAIFGNGWIIDTDSNKVRPIISDKFTPFRFLMGIGTVLQQSTSFKRDLIDRGLRFNTNNRVCWDTEFHCDALKLGALIKNVPDSIGLFRIQPESITSSQDYLARLSQERNRLLSNYFPEVVIKARGLPSLFFRLIRRVKNTYLFLTNPPE